MKISAVLLRLKAMAEYSVAPLFLICVGCISDPASVSARWRAPGSTLEQNMAAAVALCPAGTSAAAARRSLGMDGRLVRYYGPTVKGSGLQGDVSFHRVADHDDWGLEYEVAGGKILLRLKSPPKDANLEDAVVARIESMKRIKTVPLTESIR